MRGAIGPTVCMKLPPELISEVARIAKKRGMAKAEVYRMLLDVGVSMHQDMEKVGIIAAVDFIFYCKQALKNQNEKVAKDKQLSLPM